MRLEFDAELKREAVDPRAFAGVRPPDRFAFHRAKAIWTKESPPDMARLPSGTSSADAKPSILPGHSNFSIFGCKNSWVRACCPIGQTFD